jgi:hypothetical protein
VLAESLGLVNKSSSSGASEGTGIDGVFASKGDVDRKQSVVR